jgi:putative chitinase
MKSFKQFLIENELSIGKWEIIASTERRRKYAENLFDLVQTAYKDTPLGSFIKTVDNVINGIKNETDPTKPPTISDWQVINLDSDPYAEATVFYRKNRSDETWIGNKIQGIGHDGRYHNRIKSSQYAVEKIVELINEEGWWIEVSDALKYILFKRYNGKFPVVSDVVFLRKLYNDPTLEMIDEVTYTRDIGSERIQESTLGKPVLKMKEESLDEGLSDWLRNIVLAAGLFASGEQGAEAKRITVYPDGKAIYTDTGKPVINKLPKLQSTKNTLLNVKADTPDERKKLLNKMAIASGIKGNELEHFIAQASHETLDFSKLEEIGSNNKFELKYGPNSRIGKKLGNDTKGDGAKFKGRGFLQLTGKYNYEKIGKILNLDLVSNPNMISKYPGVAAATAIAYWKWRVKPNVKSFATKDTVSKVTKQISGSSKEKHIDRRKPKK